MGSRRGMKNKDCMVYLKRIFHPVGQGAFFTEQLVSSSDEKVLYNVVYDCGSKTTGIRHKMEEEIDGMYNKNHHVNALFLSHFDDDHINYVKYLRTQGYLADAKVFIPLLFEEKFLPVTVLYLNYLTLINELEKDGIKIVWVKMDDGLPKEQEINIEEKNIDKYIESGVKLKYEINDIIWYWVPFNIKYKERIEEFRKRLESEDIKLDELCSNDAYMVDNKALKRIYQTLNKDQGDGYGTVINFNSLQLMSYPASPDYCVDYVRETICDSYFADNYKWNKGYMKYKFQEKENLYPGSCLYTGDTSANSPRVWKTLMDKIDSYLQQQHLVLFQIPHHGSKHSNDERIVDEERIYAAFTNFDPDYRQKIYDPNISLQFYLCRKPLILVTNDDSFKFEECWFLNK